jgi:CRP/FNR family transcriptional regulator
LIDLEKYTHFRDLSDKGKSLIVQGLSKVSCDASSTVLHRGQSVSGAYFVLSGQLRVYSLSPSGTEATLYSISPGETCVFALNCLFNDLLYPAWVEAESATTVAVIPGATFRQLFQTEPSIQDITVRSLSTIVFRLMTELEQVHSSTLSQRLANLILLRATAEGKVHMTQKSIASHLGTTREVVAKLMCEFSALNYVKTYRGLIVIKDSASLTKLLTTIKQ